MGRLAQIVPLSQLFLAEVLAEGDLAVDLTAGNGHDTLFLCRCVGSAGKVIAFDLQQQALENTQHKLAEEGLGARLHHGPPAEWSCGIHLVAGSHDRVAEFVNEPVRAVIANLGYLPGGDKTIVTRPETTLDALAQAARLLCPGGRLAVVLYTGHAGGSAEADQVDTWFRGLKPSAWDVLRIEAANRKRSPYLLISEKK